MSVLVDTSVLGRLANQADVAHSVAVHAVAELHRRGEVLHSAPQNLIEFRAFATRPIAVNGLGLAPAVVEALTVAFEAAFPLVDETPDLYPAWKNLVQGLAVVGKQVHDARLVAICHVHGIPDVLTFNVAHFSRLATFGPGIEVIDPANV